MRYLLSMLLLIALLQMGWAQQGIPLSEVKPGASIGKMIYWSTDRPLAWRDFEALPPTKGKIRQTVKSASFLALDYDSCEGDQLLLSITAVFSPAYSWARPMSRDVSRLRYARLHFDLTEFYARKLRRLLQGFTQCTDSKYVRLVTRRIGDELAEEHDLIDRETEYGYNRTMVDYWSKKLKARLDRTRAFYVEPTN